MAFSVLRNQNLRKKKLYLQSKASATVSLLDIIHHEVKGKAAYLKQRQIRFV